MGHYTKRVKTFVRTTVDKFFARFNMILALVFFAYAVVKIYEYGVIYDYLTWDVIASSSAVMACSILILIDRSHNLVRTVGLMAVGLGLERVFTAIPTFIPHELWSLIPLTQLILGLNLMVSGRSYMKGVTRGRMLMTLSAILIASLNISTIISMVLSNISITTCFMEMPGTFVTIFLYVMFIAVLDSAYLRSKDIMEIHNTTLEGIRNTYVQGETSFITEDVARVLNVIFSDRSAWTLVDDGSPVESEYQFKLDNRIGRSYMILQKWKESDVIHATVTDHSVGTIIHAQRFDLIDVYLDGDDVEDSGVITLIGKGRRMDFTIFRTEVVS